MAVETLDIGFRATTGIGQGAINPSRGAPASSGIGVTTISPAIEAEETLILLGSPAVEPLIAIIEDDNRNVRQTAIQALGQIKDLRAVDALIAIL